MAQSPQVIKSNALIEAKYKLTVAEQRLILACIAQIRERTESGATDNDFYIVSAADMAELIGGQLKHVYEDLAEAASRLFRREVWIQKAPNSQQDTPYVMVTRWVQTVNYKKNEGKVELRFSRDILPYIDNLSAHFTRYPLADVAKMDSTHAIRLYELLVQYAKVGERELSIAQLKDWMMLEGLYASTYDFKRYVVDVAIRQINKLTQMHVAYTPIKSGRAVVAFLFAISHKKPEKIIALTDKQISVFTKKLAEDETFSRFAKTGESYNDFANRLAIELKSPDYIEKYRSDLIRIGFVFY